MESNLSQQALERLLCAFHESREKAEQEYLRQQKLLTSYFEYKGAGKVDPNAPELLADKTLDRVSHKLAEGYEITQIGAFIRKDAEWVLREFRRKQPTGLVSIDDLKKEIPMPSPNDLDGLNECGEHCIGQLSSYHRVVILSFYDPEATGRELGKRREELAQRLQVTRNALGKLAQRIRENVESCVKNCLHPRTMNA